MEHRALTEKEIEKFKVYLCEEEKSENTIEKYIRDIKAFVAYIGNAAITKETVIA